MIIKLQKEKFPKLLKSYSALNRGLAKRERIAWRAMPWLKYIKLYLEDRLWNFYIPIWQYADWLQSKYPKLEEKVVYNIEKEKVWIEKGFVNQDQIDEQSHIINILKEQGRRSWLIEMKTWRWKWNLIVKMCEHFNEKTLILVHSIDTLKELKQKFLDFSNYEPWVYYWQKKKIKDITITTHSSFIKSYNKVFKWNFDILLYDECDYNLSKDMLKAIILSDVNWIFWLTGTPERQDLRIEALELVYWPHIKKESQKNNWYNLIPKIVRLEYYSKEEYNAEHFAELRKLLSYNKDRVQKQVDFVVKHLKEKYNYALILISTLEESELYYEMFKEQTNVCVLTWQWNIDCDWNRLSKNTDKKIIDDMLSRWSWVFLWTSGKMSRWRDVPAVDAVFLYYPCRFYWNIIQACWRGLRNYEWKKWAYVFDWIDLPIHYRQWREKVMAYKREYWEDVEIVNLKI